MTYAGSCDLANTGMPVGAVLAIGAVFVLAGLAALVVFGARSRRARTGGALVLLLVVTAVLGVAGGGGTAARAAGTATSISTGTAIASVAVGAATEDCPPGGTGGGGGGGAENSLTIIQTSVNTGIAPGAAPTTLVGTITNHGTATVPIAEVTVSISSVTKAPGAVDGVCDASDYVLSDASMPVGQTLAPEQAAEFRGATIGFSDKGVNQDACKGATLNLLYVSS